MTFPIGLQYMLREAKLAQAYDSMIEEQDQLNDYIRVFLGVRPWQASTPAVITEDILLHKYNEAERVQSDYKKLCEN
jgi:menaquinone-dependent protoporphyrinogen IX oxidase